MRLAELVERDSAELTALEALNVGTGCVVVWFECRWLNRF